MKATRAPRTSELRWAIVDRNGKFWRSKMAPYVLLSRRHARDCRDDGERVVRVRVTVEVVE